MKVAIGWLLMLVVAVVTAASCSINHRSGEFECTKQADCTGGRVCSNGYCVVPGGVIDAPKNIDAPMVVDAPTDAPTNLCPPQCTTCNVPEKKCFIDCQQTNCLSTTLVCPAGWNCNIDCTTANSCRNGVNCSNAASCAINCAGNSSCRQLVSGPGPFLVECKGLNSCRSLNCDASCACDITCADPALCELVTCAAQTCGTLDGGCTSQRLGCETCP